MAPRGFTNPAPKTESARAALSAFTCSLCNKSYARHPEYEAHIGSYDHQHRRRLQDLKELSRDPNAAEKARRAERKADEQNGLTVIDTPNADTSNTLNKGKGGFKKGGFKSSFAAVKGPTAPAKKNVLGDDDDDPPEVQPAGSTEFKSQNQSMGDEAVESDTDEDYAPDLKDGGGYYNPRKPTACSPSCPGYHANAEA